MGKGRKMRRRTAGRIKASGKRRMTGKRPSHPRLSRLFQKTEEGQEDDAEGVILCTEKSNVNDRDIHSRKYMRKGSAAVVPNDSQKSLPDFRHAQISVNAINIYRFVVCSMLYRSVQYCNMVTLLAQ